VSLADELAQDARQDDGPERARDLGTESPADGEQLVVRVHEIFRDDLRQRGRHGNGECRGENPPRIALAGACGRGDFPVI
jgi:hypothetical protein